MCSACRIGSSALSAYIEPGTLDPGAPQNEDSFLPVAYAFFVCEDPAFLTGNINFREDLLNVLLSRRPRG